MLVLSRKVGERILIGDKICVTVVRIAPGVVRLGIDAPPDSSIAREELIEGARTTSSSAESSSADAADSTPRLPR